MNEKLGVDDGDSDIEFVYESIDIAKYKSTPNKKKDEEDDASDTSFIFSLPASSNSIEIIEQSQEIINLEETNHESTQNTNSQKTSFMNLLSLKRSKINRELYVLIKSLPKELQIESVDTKENPILRQHQDIESNMRKSKKLKVKDKTFIVQKAIDEEDWISPIARTRRELTKCVTCGEYVTNLRKHSYIHLPKFICDVCGREFYGSFNLRKHMLRTHTSLVS